MTKPTKKRIDEVAERLFAVVDGAKGPYSINWSKLCGRQQDAWRHLAKYVLTEPGLLPRKTTMPKPKSCKIVRGKAVCD